MPVLTFSGCLKIDWHIFKRSFINICLLAGPGVIINTFLVGCSLKLVLAYSSAEMTWPMAFMLGAIFSPTDPSSAVSILSELGMSSRFNTLIEGESILNGGISMILF